MLEFARSSFDLALVSNFDHPPHVRKVLQSTGLAPFFDVVVISGDVGVKKPDPRIFDPALKRCQLRPNQVVYVGDSLEDFQGATAAKLTPIIIRRYSGDRSGVAVDFRQASRVAHTSIARAEYRIQSLGQIKQLQILEDRPNTV